LTRPADPAKSDRPGFGRGDFYLLAVTIIWGANFPISKTVLNVLDPVVFSALRYLSGGALLVLILLLRGQSLRLDRRDVLPLVGLGILGITIFQGLWAYGLNYTTAPKAAVLVATAPIFGALLAGFSGRWPSGQSWLGIALSFLGVGVVINGSVTQFNLGGGTLLGDMLMIGGSAVWAIYTALSTGPVQRLGAFRVMAFGMVSGGSVLMLMALPFMATQVWSDMTLTLWASTAFSAVLAAALSFVWWYEGVALLGITRGMVYSYLIPIVAIIVSVAAFGADFNMVQVIASFVVLAGVQLTRTG
jgi:drug/metabolite transporter (DMT)-like permease